MENSMNFLKNLIKQPTYDPTVLILDIYPPPKKKANHYVKEMCAFSCSL